MSVTMQPIYKGKRAVLDKALVGKPKFQLAENVPVTDEFRAEFNEWALNFFGWEEEIVEGAITVWLGPRAYQQAAEETNRRFEAINGSTPAKSVALPDMYQSLEVTPWFYSPGNRPSRPGLYQVTCTAGPATSVYSPHYGWSYYDGEYWYGAWDTPQRALDKVEGYRTPYNDTCWRGVTSQLIN